jgi:site-specific DNA recombinase
MAEKRAERTRWVSCLRVSTVEQAETELSLAAQRHSAEEFAARHEAVIDHHYVEPGASGTDIHRAVFNELLGDALRPGSTIAVIVVHHTSRFTRDATHARVVKKELRRAGVRVLSVTQELTEDPMGTLMEGFFECIDQCESEVNGLRTAAANARGRSPRLLSRRAHAVRLLQGAGRGARWKEAAVQARRRAERGRDPPHDVPAIRHRERRVKRRPGAQRARLPHAEGNLWDKGGVIQTLGQTAAGGVVRWGVYHRGKLQPPDKWITLPVEPIIDAKTHALVKQPCEQRRPTELPGRASSKPRMLTGIARCGHCGSSYQLETSGKYLDGATYSYCYYNCRKTLRAGKKACAGFRVRVEDLDGAVLAAIADVVCTPERAGRLARGHQWPPIAEVITAWRNFILRDHDIGRTYALHLIDHVDVHGERVVIVPKVAGGRKDLAMLAAAE